MYMSMYYDISTWGFLLKGDGYIIILNYNMIYYTIL